MLEDSESGYIAKRSIIGREILRVAATVDGTNPSDTFETVREEVLKWAKNRVPGNFSDAAWHGERFEHLEGGRPTLGVLILDNRSYNRPMTQRTGPGNNPPCPWSAPASGR